MTAVFAVISIIFTSYSSADNDFCGKDPWWRNHNRLVVAVQNLTPFGITVLGRDQIERYIYPPDRALTCVSDFAIWPDKPTAVTQRIIIRSYDENENMNGFCVYELSVKMHRRWGELPRGGFGNYNYITEKPQLEFRQLNNGGSLYSPASNYQMIISPEAATADYTYLLIRLSSITKKTHQ